MADEEAPPATMIGDQLYNKYKDKTFSPPDPSKYTTNEKMTDTEKERIKKKLEEYNKPREEYKNDVNEYSSYVIQKFKESGLGIESINEANLSDILQIESITIHKLFFLRTFFTWFYRFLFYGTKTTDLYSPYENVYNSIMKMIEKYTTTTRSTNPYMEIYIDNIKPISTTLSGGSKSRRRHRRKPARKTSRRRTRKSKSKSKTHRRGRHSHVRKHKKNTYTRLR
jgi:hypothetical protein